MEKKNDNFDALVNRRQKLQSLLLSRQRQCSKRPSEENMDEDVIDDTPIKRPKMRERTPEKHTRALPTNENISTSTISFPISHEFISNPSTPAKTPFKNVSNRQLLETERALSTNENISTSTISFPISHEFFSNPSTPANTPFKNVSNRELLETEFEIARASPCVSSATPVCLKDSYLALPETKFASRQAGTTDHCAHSAPSARYKDTYLPLPETELAIRDIVKTNLCAPAAPSVSFKDMYLPLPETELATRHATTTDPCTASAPYASFKDTTTTDPCTPSAPYASFKDIYVPLPETELATRHAAMTESCSLAAPSASFNDTYLPLPETELATRHAVTTDPCAPSGPSASFKDTYVPLPASEPVTRHAAMTNPCSPSASSASFKDTYLPLPETEPASCRAAVTEPCAPAVLSASYLPLPETEQATRHAVTTDPCSPITKSQKRRERRRKATTFKKSYLDFKPDDEQQDFSAGSSDVWTCSETDLSSEDDKKNKKNKRKRTDHTTVCEEQNEIKKKEKRINFKKVTKQLKDDGKEYTTKKGKIVEAKSMKENPCTQGKCKRGCFEITEERRNSIFSFYWSIDVQRRRDWLVRCAREENIKRKRTESNRRNRSFEYYINDGEGHRKVCQKFLLSTLDITQRHLIYTLLNSTEGMSQTEKRKRNIPDKYSEFAKNYVRKFIEKLPACPSHYNRKNSKRQYLAQSLRNLSNLYRIYLEDCKKEDEESVSETIFRNIFLNEYDLGFHSPKKDKCTFCTKAENSENDMNEIDKKKYKIHLEEKEATYKRFKAHQTLKDAETVTCSFDLQKVLNTPFGESMLLYYSRKYAVYNFTVYESITQNVFCYTWGECDGKRGSIEMATCLYLYLKELDKKGVKNALLYCDSCSGQNKNKTVLSVLNYYLHVSENLQVIQINYLLPGHTYMPADSVHATIEAEVKKIIVWSPSQWASYFETARKKPKPYDVTVMECTDFINWEGLVEKTFTKETSKPIKFKEIRVATFKKMNVNQIEIKYSMKDEAVTEKVTLFKKILKKGKGKGKGKRKRVEETAASQCQEMEYQLDLNTIELLPMYSKKLPIPTAKYKDLQKLCKDGVIPKRFHREFLEMPYEDNKIDTLLETDDEDKDESVEEEFD